MPVLIFRTTFSQVSASKTMGHCLVWHSQTNPWFFEGANRDVALARLRDHIQTLVGHFRSKISGWDVVNEAINDAAGAPDSENLPLGTFDRNLGKLDGAQKL